jgi:hypothetical protein
MLLQGGVLHDYFEGVKRLRARNCRMVGRGTCGAITGVLLVK